ncbi:uncharacterized protein LOC133196087 [Saccostrea echinata]|uniref:uncharacterized protein LOC133196087 n=1 Tax=Saccostrea echinata TaxID=191078 RepID=UPI002A81783E|nr:uncharacterized protein LOC133196087 [Saccostrea echinata]
MEGTILLILSLLKSYSFTDAAFTYTPLETGFCESTNANLTWVFDNAGAQSAVEWTVNDTISIARLFGGSTFVEGTGYSGKLQNDGNGGLIIKGVTPADSGKYKCAVSYNDGTPQATNEQTVTIYRTLNTKLDILEKKTDSKEEAELTSSLVDSSITYTWNSAYFTNFPTESSITVSENGEYRLCISGGKAQCLNQTLSNCVNYTVSGLQECVLETIFSDAK